MRFAIPFLFAIATLHGPKLIGKRLYAVLIALLSLSGMAVAARHIWPLSKASGSRAKAATNSGLAEAKRAAAAVIAVRRPGSPGTAKTPNRRSRRSTQAPSMAGRIA